MAVKRLVVENLDAHQLRIERAWRQRGLAAGEIRVESMFQISAEVREIDAELKLRGERSW